MPKKLLFISSLSALLIGLHGEELPRKKLAIVYEEGKTPQELFHKAFDLFSKLTQTGELKSAKLGSAKIFGEVIDVQTATDNASQAHYERDVAAIAVRNAIEATNVPYSGRFSILATNLFFGDKSLGYVINPYRGCYNHNYLAKGFEESGYQLVKENENPDLTIKIGIDVCMAENEYKEYIQKNSALKVKNQTASSNGSNSSLGNDLMRAGSTAQLGTPNGGGNAGMAVAGVGLALNMANWLMTKAQQERDMIRYHVTFSGKEKKTLEFYPLVITKNTHKEGQPIDIGSYQEIEKLVYSSFVGWNMADKTFEDNLPPLLLEKDIVKMTEQMVSAKNNKTKETNQ